MKTVSIKTKPTKYKYVVECLKCGKTTFMAGFKHNGKQNTKHYPTEKEAAIAVDVYLISKGKDPVNILIKKI